MAGRFSTPPTPIVQPHADSRHPSSCVTLLLSSPQDSPKDAAEVGSFTNSLGLSMDPAAEARGTARVP